MRSLQLSTAVLLLLATSNLASASSHFIRGIVVPIDGFNWYFDGVPDGPGGSEDIPGHAWRQTSSRTLDGQHFNTGPFGAPQWWASMAPDGALLYTVEAVIDTWSRDHAEDFFNAGFSHYHEFVEVNSGQVHPDKVVWLRHTAADDFLLDGGPPSPLNVPHMTMHGEVDLEFIPNAFRPYAPDNAFDLSSPNAVPEPATLLVWAGLFGIAAIMWGKKSKRRSAV